MTNDLIVKSESNSMMESIMQLAKDKDFDAEKLKVMQEMFFAQQDREKEEWFVRDFIAAQAEIPPILKTKYNEGARKNYATLENILDALNPIMGKYGFALSFGTFTSKLEGHVGVSARLFHKSSHSKEFFYDSPIDNMGQKGQRNKTDCQGAGSSLTYGQRYLTTLIWNILTVEKLKEDNDGQGILVQTINEEQVAALEALIEEIGMNKNIALEHWKIDKLSDIPVSRFEACIQALEKRRERVGI